MQRARRLYVYQPDREWKNGPNIAWFPQRLANNIINELLRSRIKRLQGEAAWKETDTKRMYRVVVTRRAGGRSLENHAAVVASLRSVLGSDFEVDDFAPAPPMWPLAQRINRGCLFIGPHGANMNNILYLEPGAQCWVVEVGYLDTYGTDTYPTPTDYYCLARNLGYKYFLSTANFSTSGGYRLVADVEELNQIAVAYKKHVEGR